MVGSGEHFRGGQADFVQAADAVAVACPGERGSRRPTELFTNFHTSYGLVIYIVWKERSVPLEVLGRGMYL